MNVGVTVKSCMSGRGTAWRSGVSVWGEAGTREAEAAGRSRSCVRGAGSAFRPSRRSKVLQYTKSGQGHSLQIIRHPRTSNARFSAWYTNAAFRFPRAQGPELSHGSHPARLPPGYRLPLSTTRTQRLGRPRCAVSMAWSVTAQCLSVRCRKWAQLTVSAAKPSSVS